MGYFYFDESIHERAGFVLGAFVYAAEDVDQRVREALSSAGLTPGVDEFKSRTRMDENPLHQRLRDLLLEILNATKIGLIIISSESRAHLGVEALRGLHKIVSTNGLLDRPHIVYFDGGIQFPNLKANLRDLGLTDVDVRIDQDSRVVGGIQVADLAARIMSVMLLEQLGLITKTVKAGPNSGYDPELDIELGFEMWASIRHQFFTQDKVDLDVGLLEGFTLDVASYALYIAESVPMSLKEAALKRFGDTYVGCIH